MSAWPRATAREPFRRRSRRGPGAGNVLCGTVLFAPCTLLHVKLRGRRGEMRFLTTATKQQRQESRAMSAAGRFGGGTCVRTVRPVASPAAGARQVPSGRGPPHSVLGGRCRL